MTEEWRPVLNPPGYLVSSIGRVASLKKGPEPRLMHPRTTEAGYLRVTLTHGNGKNVYRRVHSLIAEAFIGPRPAHLVVRHLDGNPGNNTLGNLAYGTALENADDLRRHGGHPNTRKDRCKHGHPFDAENTLIRKRGGRTCRACRAVRTQRERVLRVAARQSKAVPA